ncbi:hypothetical protein EDD86DRAFT_271633, partial [Gorgonomyces haynaldii]
MNPNQGNHPPRRDYPPNYPPNYRPPQQQQYVVYDSQQRPAYPPRQDYRQQYVEYQYNPPTQFPSRAPQMQYQQYPYQQYPQQYPPYYQQQQTGIPPRQYPPYQSNYRPPYQGQYQRSSSVDYASSEPSYQPLAKHHTVGSIPEGYAAYYQQNHRVSIPPRAGSVPDDRPESPKSNHSGNSPAINTGSISYNPNVVIPSRVASAAKRVRPQVAVQPRQEFTRSSTSMFSSETPVPPIVNIPSRNTSKMQSENADALLNQGTAAVTHPKFNLDEAMERWSDARMLCEKSQDLIGMAKSMSNMACLMRTQGKCKEALGFIHQSWLLTIQYIQESVQRHGGSSWLQLAIRAVNLNGSEVDSAFITKSSPTTEDNRRKQEYCEGPPIVIWLLQLLNNIGNIHYAMGEYAIAIRNYDACLSLVESTLEEFSLPPELAPIAAAAKPMGSTAPPSAYGARTSYRLSSLHKQVILALARSLSHLGLCYGQLGAAATNLQYQLASHTFISTMASRVPSLLSPNAFGARTSSISGASHDVSDFVILQATITANVGAAWYATGDVGKSIEWNEKSCRLFDTAAYVSPKQSEEKRQVGLDETRQISNLASTYLHIGTSIKAMQWSRLVQDAAPGQEPVSWRTPVDEFNLLQNKPDEGTPAATQVMDRGLGLFYEQANRQHILKDRFGLSITLLNIVVGTTLPPCLVPKVLLTLSQILFSISLFEFEKPGIPLGKYFLKCGGDKIQMFLGTLTPAYTRDLSELLPSTVMDFLHFVAVHFRKIHQIKNTPNITSFLHRAVAGLFPSSPPNKAKSLCLKVPSKIAFPSTIDTVKQSLATLHVTMAKLSWSMAMQYPGVDSALCYSQGKRALEYVVFSLFFDYAHLTMDENPGTKDFKSAENKGILLFLISTLVADAYDLVAEIQPDVGSSIIAGYLGFPLFPFLANILSTKARAGAGHEELLKVLRVNKTDAVERFSEAAVDVCRQLIQKNLDMCGECFDAMMSQYEIGDKSFMVSLPSHATGEVGLVPCIHGTSK